MFTLKSKRVQFVGRSVVGDKIYLIKFRLETASCGWIKNIAYDLHFRLSRINTAICCHYVSLSHWIHVIPSEKQSFLIYLLVNKRTNLSFTLEQLGITGKGSQSNFLYAHGKMAFIETAFYIEPVTGARSQFPTLNCMTTRNKENLLIARYLHATLTVSEKLGWKPRSVGQNNKPPALLVDRFRQFIMKTFDWEKPAR